MKKTAYTLFICKSVVKERTAKKEEPYLIAAAVCRSIKRRSDRCLKYIYKTTCKRSVSAKTRAFRSPSFWTVRTKRRRRTFLPLEEKIYLFVIKRAIEQLTPIKIFQSFPRIFPATCPCARPIRLTPAHIRKALLPFPPFARFPFCSEADVRDSPKNPSLSCGAVFPLSFPVFRVRDKWERTRSGASSDSRFLSDFLSNLLPQEDERLRCWFYTESELYRYGIKFLLRYKLEDYSTRNVYTEMFSLKDLTARGYFMQFMTDLSIEYQWLYLHLQKEIEGRQELFKKPKERKHARFIKELKAIAKKANTTPMEYFEKTFLLYLESKCSKQNLAYAKKELGFYVVKENDLTPIPEQLKKVIKSLPKKVRERLESLKRK